MKHRGQPKRLFDYDNFTSEATAMLPQICTLTMTSLQAKHLHCCLTFANIENADSPIAHTCAAERFMPAWGRVACAIWLLRVATIPLMALDGALLPAGLVTPAAVPATTHHRSDCE